MFSGGPAPSLGGSMGNPTGRTPRAQTPSPGTVSGQKGGQGGSDMGSAARVPSWEDLSHAASVQSNTKAPTPESAPRVPRYDEGPRGGPGTPTHAMGPQHGPTPEQPVQGRQSAITQGEARGLKALRAAGAVHRGLKKVPWWGWVALGTVVVLGVDRRHRGKPFWFWKRAPKAAPRAAIE